jgi:hypothetical protein
MGSAHQPNRGTYDLNNNRPVLITRVDAAGTNSKTGRIVFGGLLNKKKMLQTVYKIKFTNQIQKPYKKTALN